MEISVKKLRLTAYIFGILMVGQVSAQNPQSLTLEACIKRAITNNLQVKQGKLQVEINQNNLQVSKLNLYPNLNGSFSQNFSSGRNIDPFTNQYTEQQVNYQNIGLSSNMLIFGGNQLRNVIKMNELSVSLAEKDQKQIEESITLNVIAAYFQVLNNEDLLEIARKQLEATKFQQKRAENLMREGVSSRATLLDLAAQIAGDELLVENAENTLQISKLYLIQLMNENTLKEFSLDRKKNIPSSVIEFKEPLPRILETSLATQSIVSAAKIRAEMSKKNIELASASKLPTVSLGLGFGTNYSSAAPAQQFISDGKPSKFVENKLKDYVLINGQKQFLVGVSEVPSGNYTDFGYLNQLSFNFNKILGLSIRVPIFNAFSAKYRIENAKIAKLQSDLMLKNTQIQLQNTVELAYKTMTAAYKRFQLLDKQLTAVEKAFEMTKVRFEEGTINSLEYTLAKSNLDKIKLSQVQAKYDYFYRTKVLDFYSGTL